MGVCVCVCACVCVCVCLSCWGLGTSHVATMPAVIFCSFFGFIPPPTQFKPLECFPKTKASICENNNLWLIFTEPISRSFFDCLMFFLLDQGAGAEHCLVEL